MEYTQIIIPRGGIYSCYIPPLGVEYTHSIWPGYLIRTFIYLTCPHFFEKYFFLEKGNFSRIFYLKISYSKRCNIKNTPPLALISALGYHPRSGDQCPMKMLFALKLHICPQAPCLPSGSVFALGLKPSGKHFALWQALRRKDVLCLRHAVYMKPLSQI